MTGSAEAILLLAKSKAAKPATRKSAFVFLALRLTLGSVAESMIDLDNFHGVVCFFSQSSRQERTDPLYLGRILLYLGKCLILLIRVPAWSD